jgi:hypothetical protein
MLGVSVDLMGWIVTIAIAALFLGGVEAIAASWRRR